MGYTFKMLLQIKSENGRYYNHASHPTVVTKTQWQSIISASLTGSYRLNWTVIIEP